MRYETVQALKAEDFKRSTGVQRSTFEKMLEAESTPALSFFQMKDGKYKDETH
jgi:hypothetical protein